MTESITEATGTTSRLNVIRRVLESAEEKQQYLARNPELEAPVRAGLEREIEALNAKAAQLIAKYGIDQAMLADAGTEADLVVDKVIWTDRPFSDRFRNMLAYLAELMGAQTRRVKEFDPQAHGGARKGAWKYGLRVFAHQSDLDRLTLLYTSARNQALAGASRIKGYDRFGQDQKAHRDSYIEGFSHGVYAQVSAAEQAAKQAAEAELEARQEQAMLEGNFTASKSVELVLSDRSAMVRRAFDLAVYGMTPEDRARQDARSAEWNKGYEERAAKRRAEHEAFVAEHESCKRCQNAKSGYCNDHRSLRPTQGRQSYKRIGQYYSDGYYDGKDADLGTARSNEVGGNGRKALH